MKEWIALITDQHFCVRNNSQVFLDYQMKFYEEVFFPALDEYDVLDIIDLGDTFDRRKTIDFNILDQVKERYYKKLQQMEKTIYCIVGNHTAYYKNTNRVNTLNLLLKDFDNIYICEEPEICRINEMDVLLMPWINEENQKVAYDLLKEKHKYCFGHLEINGFEMYRGHVHRDGEFDIGLFSNVENVFSGHFHHRSRKGNVMYLGNPYQLTWGDYDDTRGFHLLNLQTGELKFIPNPNIMFHRLVYDETVQTKKLFTKENLKQYKDRFVKVLVREKNNITMFQKHMNNLISNGPLDVMVLENDMNFSAEEGEQQFSMDEENTLELCIQSVNRYVQENCLQNGEEITSKLLSLYNQVELEKTLNE